MFNVHRIVVALFFILLCTMAADRTDCTKDYFRDPAQSYLIKAGTAWIGHALERNNFVLDSNECKKVWCIDGASIYFCNDPDHGRVKGHHREIGKRAETLADACHEGLDGGLTWGEIRNRVSHVSFDWDESDCYVEKPEDY